MRKIKNFIALALTGSMLVQPVMASQVTEDEIEKRIEEVGEEYLRFYRDGNSYLYDDYSYKAMSPAGTSAGSSGEEAAAQGASAGISGGLFGGLFGFDKIINTAPEYEYSAFDTEEAYEDIAEAGAVYDSYADSSVYSSQALREASEFDMFDSYNFNTEEYKPVKENGFVSVATQPFSTFGADVDTASYSSLRRKLMEPYATGSGYYGIDDSAIRLEEMVNYFTYHYPEATDDKFGVTTTLNPCPWNEDSLLLKVGIKAESVKEESKGSNIVFLIDTSGSMDWFDALPLVKSAMGILVEKLDENDIVSIVTYAGSEEVVLEGVKGDKNRILSAINSLSAYGGTYGEGGINKAYEIAEKYRIEGGNNRIVLCTDGDFNLGVSSEAGLKDLISKKRDTGIFFSCLGFGSGNYSDTTMLTLADNGNGNYFYIDCEKEAEKALDTEFFSTIFTVAKDTKFQVEFNPKTVKGYRLLGYEKRAMAAEDFADDTKDGGEVGADHTVTVLYEIIPADSKYEIPTVESRYGNEVKVDEENEEKTELNDELLVVNIRYKEPDLDTSVLRTYPVSKADLKKEMDDDTSWAAGVAQAAMLMRDSEYAGTSSFDEIFNRLKNDPEIMDNDFKAQFLFMLRVMKDYKENNTK